MLCVFYEKRMVNHLDILIKDIKLNSDNKINIDSYRDNYKIDSEPILDDFEFKAKQSFVVFTFANQPTNLKFQLNDSFCNTKLPLDWSSDFTIGLGQPKMSVDVCECVFQLFANN